MNGQSSSTGVVIGVLVVLVVLVIAYLAYVQGYFTSKAENQDSSGLEIKVGGTANSPS